MPIVTSRTYNSAKNISWGLIVTVVNTLVTFVNRTVFVKCLGIDYLGLNSLFVEIITMLSLAELGVGMAINYSLYKPIHDGFYEKQSQLMALYKKFYNYIALIIFVIGVLILPFVHLIVNGTDFSLNYVRLVFFLFVVNTSSSYFLSYNQSYISANQKQYVVSLVTVGVKALFTIVFIVSLLITHNYILYLVLVIAQTLVTNIILSIYVKKKYPFLNFTEKLPKDEINKIFADIKNIFIKRVSGVLSSSSSNVLISIFVNTIQVGIYSNYVIILSLFKSLNAQLSNGVKASIGDLVASGDNERCIVVLKRLTFMFYVLSIIGCSVLLAACSDFITIWLGSEYVMQDYIVFVVIANLFSTITFEPLWEYLEVSGLFKQDRNIAIIGSIVNLAVAFVLGYYVGMVGIFLGNLFSQLLQMVLKTNLLFNKLFKESGKHFLWMITRMLTTLMLICLIEKIFISNVSFNNNYIDIIIHVIMALIIGVFVILMLFYKTDEYNYSFQILVKFIDKINYKLKK